MKMAIRGELTQVQPTTQRPILLDEMLRPMWKCLRYSGIHHRFLNPMEERRSFYLIRCVLTVLIIVLLLIFDALYLRNFVGSILKENNLHEIFMSTAIIVGGFTINVSVYQLYAHQQHLVEFFKDWNQLEMQFSICCHRNRTKKILIGYYSCFFVILTFYCVSSFIYMLVLPQNQSSLSQFRVLRLIFGVSFLGFTQSFSNITSFMFLFLAEMLPAFFYYQAGCAIENLELQLQNSITPTNNYHLNHFIAEIPYHVIWKRYETIKGLVDRANQLLGVIVIANQFNFIIWMCLNLHGIVLPEEESNFVSTNVTGLMAAILRIFWLNWTMSHVFLSCENLRNSVADVLSSQWHLLSEEHRDLLTSFLLRLNSNNIAASPLNMYTIDPSNVLTLFTLHTSYSMFLLQS